MNKIEAKKKEYYFPVAAGIYAGVSWCYLFDYMIYPSHFAGSIFSIPLLMFCIYVQYKFWNGIRNDETKIKRRRLFFGFLFSFLLALSFIIGYQMKALGMTALGFLGKFLILVFSGGAGLLFLPVTYKILEWLDHRGIAQKEILSKSPLGFGKCLLIIILGWIPYFLAYYPAIMSYDFHRQSQEAYRGYIWFNDHHPLIHTFLIRVFLLLGQQIGSYQAAMALFSAFQMMILACALAYSCTMIGRFTGKKWTVIVSALIYALLPIHPVLAMSMTKDILFAAFYLLLLLLILEMSFCTKRVPMVLLALGIIVTGILAMLLRNNAVYAFLLFAVFYVMLSKKRKLLYLILSVIIIAGGIFGRNAIRSAMNAGQGSKVEMYSVFLQQFTRAAASHEEFLSPEDFEIIDRYVDHSFWEEYNPTISDPIKGKVADTNFLRWQDDIAGMLKDWIRIGLHYPNDYLDAAFALTSGYWFLDDVSHAEVLGYGETTNLGLLYTFNASKSDVFQGIESKSLFPPFLRLCSKIVNGNAYQLWPVISCLFKPAFYNWILFGVIMILIYMKKYRKLLPCMLPLLYLLTLFFGPVVNMRYVYPVIITTVLLVAWIFSGEMSSGKEHADEGQKP